MLSIPKACLCYFRHSKRTSLLGFERNSRPAMSGRVFRVGTFSEQACPKHLTTVLTQLIILYGSYPCTLSVGKEKDVALIL